MRDFNLVVMPGSVRNGSRNLRSALGDSTFG